MKDGSNGRITVFTVGYAGKSARAFFELLKQADVHQLIDVRLYNTSQLAGYAKRDDLAYFAKAIVGAEYVHLPRLAPTKELLNDFKQERIGWGQYEAVFNDLMAARHAGNILCRSDADRACLLCAEAKAERCHRRLVAEYLAAYWGGIEIIHL